MVVERQSTFQGCLSTDIFIVNLKTQYKFLVLYWGTPAHTRFFILKYLIPVEMG
jgi:hypothetical protein